MGAEVDNIPPLNEGNTLCPHVYLCEFLLAVRAHGRKILPFDDRERFVIHLWSPPWRVRYYAPYLRLFRVVHHNSDRVE